MCKALLHNTIYEDRLFPYFTYSHYIDSASSRAAQIEALPSKSVRALFPISEFRIPNLIQFLTILKAEELVQLGCDVVFLLRDFGGEVTTKIETSYIKILPPSSTVVSLKTEVAKTINAFDDSFRALPMRDFNPESVNYYRQLLGILFAAKSINCNVLFLGQPEAPHLEALLRQSKYFQQEEGAAWLLPLYLPELSMPSLPDILISDDAATIKQKLLDSLKTPPINVSRLAAELILLSGIFKADALIAKINTNLLERRSSYNKLVEIMTELSEVIIQKFDNKRI